MSFYSVCSPGCRLEATVLPRGLRRGLHERLHVMALGSLLVGNVGEGQAPAMRPSGLILEVTCCRPQAGLLLTQASDS